MLTAVSALSWSRLSPSKTSCRTISDMGRARLARWRRRPALYPGKDHERAPGVGRALLPGDQTPPLHPAQLVRHAALLPGQRVGELEYPPTALRRLAKHDQHIVVRQGNSVVVLQLPVHPGVQLGGHPQQPTPGLVFSSHLRPGDVLYLDEAGLEDERRVLDEIILPSIGCEPVGATPLGLGLVVTGPVSRYA